MMQKKIANAIKANFLRLYPEYSAYLDWESPNFKVRVGDFKLKLDAMLFWKQIKDFFPKSYVVRDEINLFKQE